MVLYLLLKTHLRESKVELEFSLENTGVLGKYDSDAVVKVDGIDKFGLFSSRSGVTLKELNSGEVILTTEVMELPFKESLFGVSGLICHYGNDTFKFKETKRIFGNKMDLSSSSQISIQGSSLANIVKSMSNVVRRNILTFSLSIDVEEKNFDKVLISATLWYADIMTS